MDRGDPADGVSAGPVHSQQVIPKWGSSGPLKSPSSLLTELPPAGPSQDPEGPGRSPCPSEQTTPETRPPPQMKTCARSGYWLDLSRFVPMFDSEDVLNILRKKKKKESGLCFLVFPRLDYFPNENKFRKKMKATLEQNPEGFHTRRNPLLLDDTLMSAG